MSVEKKNGGAGGAPRNSGIEALKILAIFLIIISHITQTLDTYNHLYVIDLSAASADPRLWALMLFRSFGVLGSTVFFSCSAWFMLDSDRYSKQKWLRMVLEIWSVSILFLAIMLIARRGDLSRKDILESLSPTTHGTNWYLTCYLLFLPLHPFLNRLIRNLSRIQLFRISLVMFVLYYGIGFLENGLFQAKEIILWITVYFVMAYLKRYKTHLIQNTRRNLTALAASLIAYAALIVIWNLLGLRYSYFRNHMIRFESFGNPFWLVCSFSLLGLAQASRLKSRAVNALSGLSLLIYILHENLLLRTYVRPGLLDALYETFGYDSILLWVLLLALVIFALSAAGAALFRAAAERPIQALAGRLYSLIRKQYLRFEKKVL